MRVHVQKRFYGFVLLVSLALLSSVAAMAEEPSRVVILPFNIHADKDLSFLREGIRDMLTSRLSWEDKVKVVSWEDTGEVVKDKSQAVNEATAQAVGNRLKADYVLFGSLTVLGNSVSLDGKMVDVHRKRPTLTFFRQGNEIDEVIPQISLFAAEIKEKAFGRPVAAGSKAAKAAPERPGIYAHPETLLTRESSDQVEPSSIESAPAEEGGFAESPDTTPVDLTSDASWRSLDFKGTIQGIALGDVDGDSKTEVVHISDRQVYVHRFQNQRLVKVWEEAGKKNRRLMAVDVADVNGNGRAEIFVTSVILAGHRLDSFVLEWNGESLESIRDGVPWYFRVIELPDQGQVLLGQKRTMDEPYVPGVFKLAWHDGEYGSNGRLTLPKGVNIFGFAKGDVINNGQQMTVAFDSGDHIRLYSDSGEEKWQSGERYGGSLNYVESWAKNEDVPDRLYLPQRIYVCDFDGDGKQQVVVPSNEGTLGRLFARLRKFTSGHIVSLSWMSLGLVPNRQTPKLSGYISDYAIGDFDNDGTNEVVVAHVGKGRVPLFGRAASSIIGYEVTPTLSAGKGK